MMDLGKCATLVVVRRQECCHLGSRAAPMIKPQLFPQCEVRGVSGTIAVLRHGLSMYDSEKGGLNNLFFGLIFWKAK